MCIHLDQISTTDNIQLESPSTLLRAIPVKDEKYNSGRTESFSSLHYKKLKRGVISDLKITFTGNLGDLSDVDVSRLNKNTSYNLIRNDDTKWTMIEEKIEWLLNIVITPPYVMMGKAHNLTKIINSGVVLGAYIPSKQKSVLVSPLPENPGHMLLSRPAVKNVSLNLVTEFIDKKDNLSAIPNLSTLIIEVLFGMHQKMPSRYYQVYQLNGSSK